MFKSITMATTVFLLCGSCMTARVSAAETILFPRVTGQETTITNDVKSIEVPMGTTVDIMSITSDEEAVVAFKDFRGTIDRRLLKYVKKYTSCGLNLRDAPKNGNVMYTMPAGTEVSILSINDGWAQVICGERVGYCSYTLLRNDRFIGGYSTPLLGNSANVNNIRVASNYINGKVVNPGETFSYLNAIGGESTPDKGYQEATVIIDGKKSTGFGGGVCQVSSTLYASIKSVENHDLIKVTERYQHSKPVGYISRDLEATVWYPSKDLKFVPSCKVKIESYVSDGRVYVNLYQVIN